MALALWAGFLERPEITFGFLLRDDASVEPVCGAELFMHDASLQPLVLKGRQIGIHLVQMSDAEEGAVRRVAVQVGLCPCRKDKEQQSPKAKGLEDCRFSYLVRCWNHYFLFLRNQIEAIRWGFHCLFLFLRFLRLLQQGPAAALRWSRWSMS